MHDSPHRNPKHQIPNKLQGPKLQIRNGMSTGDSVSVIEVLDLGFVWDLGFGILPPCHNRGRNMALW
jgi:hypothetical protein